MPQTFGTMTVSEPGQARRCRADVQANPNSEMPLVDESLAVGEDGDARRACGDDAIEIPRCF